MTQQQKTCCGCGHFKPHNDGTPKGWCLLFNRFAKKHHRKTATCEQEELPLPIGNIPKIGDNIFIGNYFFCCTNSNTEEWLGVYDIKLDNHAVAEAYLNYDGFWYYNLSDSNFGTPQEIVIDLDATLKELS
ncbi:MAG TPA: hypothetical protein VK184_26970 [Nostocaceae cyanobacterium]|nr:hypothetical protein [Nostocaceae cyanobacterium]